MQAGGGELSDRQGDLTKTTEGATVQPEQRLLVARGGTSISSVKDVLIHAA